MLPKDFQSVRNGPGAPETSAASLICRVAPGTTIDPEHCPVDRGTLCASAESLYAGQLRHQERFLFEVLRQGQLPMRSVLELGPETGRLSRWLAKIYPSA